MVKPRIIVVAAVVFFITVNCASASQPKHIHLTWQDDPSRSITVSWRTNSSEPSIVRYGLDSSYGMTRNSSPGEIHHVKLNDLQPATIYHYMCGSEEGWSQDFTFRTGPANLSTNLTFVALGDSRTNMHTWARVSNAVLELKPEFVIHTGDIVESGNVQKQWNWWFERAEALLSEIVLMPCLGNHENNAREYFQQFALPDAEQWYSFDYGNTHFVALTTEGPMTGQQLEWLVEDLSSTRAMWKFVFYHRPMYSVGSHGPSISVQNAWGDILDKYQVDLVFNGHDHLYVRTFPIYNGEVVNSTDMGTVHIVTGGAGAGLHGVENPGYDWLAYALSEHHYVIITIDGQNLQMEARTLDHNVFDSLDIVKRLYPDLAVSKISLLPDIPGPRSTADVSIEVLNKGHKVVEESSVQLLVDGDSVQVKNIPTIHPGETRVIEFEWNTSEEGLYNLTVQVDPLNEIDEGRFELNNHDSILALVSRAKPDLVPISIEVINGNLTEGEDMVLQVNICNEGNKAAEQFDINFRGGGLDFYLHQASLSPGENRSFELTPIRFDEGDWEVELEVDPHEKVEELREENNILCVDVTIRNYVKDGAAYYPKGPAEGDVLVIRYNDLEGAIPENSEDCSLLWGVNGWENPSLIPPGSVWSGGIIESVMERGLDGFWQIKIPTGIDVEMVNFMFRNGQLIGDVIDDNSGKTWVVYMKGWAEEAIEELEQKIFEAKSHGLNTSLFEDVLQTANAYFSSDDYGSAVSSLGNTTDVIEREMILYIYDLALEAYSEAVKDGISIPRAEVFLFAAYEAMEEGNYLGSRTYLNKVMSMVEEAHANIGEMFLLLIVSLIIPLRKVIR